MVVRVVHSDGEVDEDGHHSADNVDREIWPAIWHLS